MRMLHGPPPMVLVSTSTYARRRVPCLTVGKCFAQKGKAPVTYAFPLIFSDAEQLALLRRKLLLGDDAGVAQRFVLLELLNGVRRSAGLRGGSRLRGTRSGLRCAGGNELHQVTREGVQRVDLIQQRQQDALRLLLIPEKNQVRTKKL